MPDDGGQGTGGFIASHPTLLIGSGVVALLLLVAFLNKRNNTTATGGTSQNLTGIAADSSGNHIVYVPTSTSFSTQNIGAEFSNDPNLQSIQTGAIVTNSPITQSTSTATTSTQITKPIVNSIPPNAPPPVVEPPKGGTSTGGVHPVKAPPTPAPPSKGIKWNSTYTVLGGDTLSGIAAKITAQIRSAGAPSNTLVTYQQIFGYNSSVITSTSNAHGNPIPGGPQNNIFPGERIIVPSWS